MAWQAMRGIGWLAALVLPVLAGCVMARGEGPGGMTGIIKPIEKAEDAKGVSNGEGWVDASGKANPDKWRVDSKACTEAYYAYSDDLKSKGNFNDYFLLCMRKAGWRPG